MTLEMRRAPVGTALVNEISSGHAAASSLSILPAQRGNRSRHAIWHVHARASLVTGRARSRLAMVVRVCPRCRHAHEHYATPDFTTGTRTAPCGVRYVVHVGALEPGGAA